MYAATGTVRRSAGNNKTQNHRQEEAGNCQEATDQGMINSQRTTMNQPGIYTAAAAALCCYTATRTQASIHSFARTQQKQKQVLPDNLSSPKAAVPSSSSSSTMASSSTTPAEQQQGGHHQILPLPPPQQQ
jgi:hypothetical protein